MTKTIIALAICLISSLSIQAESSSIQATSPKTKKQSIAPVQPATGKPVTKFEIGRNPIYKKGWIDYNKNGRMDVYEDPNAPIEERIEDLLSQMTVDEKTAQMVTLYGYGRVLVDDLPNDEWKNRSWKDGVGAIDEHLNGFRNWGLPLSDNPNIWPASRHAWAINEVQRFFVEHTRLGIPVDFTNEGIRGVEAAKATNFPTQLALGHTWDRELIEQVGYITGREARLLGFTNVYAPILDVGRDQRWGRYEEIYGEDPYLVAELGVAMVRGLQRDFQVASTGKHFIAYSNNKGAREGMARLDPQMAPHEVENVHVYPWREVIQRTGMLGVMSSYNDYDGEPVQGSHYWLSERLRGDFGFKGYVVSDSDAVEYLHTKHHVTKDMKESVRQVVMAGLNVRCTFRSPDSYVLPLRELVNEGSIPMSVIDDRVRDILRVKFMVGIFDEPYQMDLQAADREVNSAANNEWSLRASRESVVLLKNNGVLPLDEKQLKSVAVIGPNATEESFARTHYGPLDTEVTSVLEGLQSRLDGKLEVSYAQGCNMVDAQWPLSEIMDVEMTAEEEAMMQEAVELASKSDVVVAVMGGGQRTCGENKSRTSLDLPGHQEKLLKALKATGKPLVVLLINGRPLSINWADANADAILEAWYPGAHGGQALAEIIMGDVNPSGKLSVTFPRTVGQIPFNFPYKPNSQVDGAKGPGLDGNQTRINGALYDFGYGLSYTSFEYSDLKLSKDVISPEESVEISFNIKNTGEREGTEIVQLYIHDWISSITVYEMQLRGFERVNLKPGESKTVKMMLSPKDLSMLDREMNRVLELGDFEIMIGASSTDIRLSQSLSVTADGKKVAQNIYPDDASAVYATLPVKLKKGEDATFRLVEGAQIDEFAIIWGKDTDCEFEILTTNGGGQFLPVYKGKAKGGSRYDYQFKETTASEVRIGILEGKAQVNEVKSKFLR